VRLIEVRAVPAGHSLPHSKGTNYECRMSTDAVHENRERLFAECKLDLLLPLRSCQKVEGQDGDSSNAIVDLSDAEPHRKCIILGESVK
jgi:hypothetical protein